MSPETSAKEAIWHLVNPALATDAPLYLHPSGDVSWERTETRLGPGAAVAYDTYFGALPSGHWRHEVGLQAVELTFVVDGTVDVSVFGTDAAGTVRLLSTRRDATGDVRIGVALSAGTDGWLWPEFTSVGNSATVRRIAWRAARTPRTASSVAVAITTFDREADCLALLRALAAPELMGIVRYVTVADQGRRNLRDAAGFGEAAALLGDRLRVVRQANLGGSGGFSRGMLDAPDDAAFVLLLDDDVRLEPESVRRLVAFASRCPRDTILGAQMLSLLDPTRIHSFGERVHRRAMWWSAVDPSLSDLDLSAGVRDLPQLSRRIDVDFNGWWMCLVPAAVIRRIGASLPFFIKWDDAEYGLRAAARGVRTVTLPGAAIWHMPWTAKDDGLDWQAYFQLRNRVVTALLHGTRGVLRASFAQDVNHLLCGQYGSAVLRETALRDVLLGPTHLDPVLRAGPARAAAILAREGQVVVPFDAAPAAEESHAGRPVGAVATARAALSVVAHQLRRARRPVPLVRLRRDQGKWWSLGVADGALVEAAAGGGVFVMRRDRDTALRQLRRAVTLRARLWWSWPRLAREYRAAADELASAPAWKARLTGESANHP